MTARWSYFILFEHLAFFLKYSISVLIPDRPPDVDMQLQRQEFLISKVIDDTNDDEDGDVETKGRQAIMSPSLTGV